MNWWICDKKSTRRSHFWPRSFGLVHDARMISWDLKSRRIRSAAKHVLLSFRFFRFLDGLLFQTMYSPNYSYAFCILRSCPFFQKNPWKHCEQFCLLFFGLGCFWDRVREAFHPKFQPPNITNKRKHPHPKFPCVKIVKIRIAPVADGNCPTSILTGEGVFSMGESWIHPWWLESTPRVATCR